MKHIHNPRMLTRDFESFLKDNGYQHIRELDDGSVAALLPLLFTTSICVDLTWDSWSSRYCFADPGKALDELSKMKSVDDVPSGFKARRGREPENDSQFERQTIRKKSMPSI